MSLFTVVLLSDALVVPAYSSATTPWEWGKVARGLVPRGEQGCRQPNHRVLDKKYRFRGGRLFRGRLSCWFVGVLFPINFKYGE